MAITYLDFFQSAKDLLESKNEVNHRNATSRAYYAVYHRAKELSKILNSIPRGTMGAHQYVSETFIKSTDRELKGVGYMLRQCHARRVDADYEIEDIHEKRDTETQILEIQKIFDRIEKFF